MLACLEFIAHRFGVHPHLGQVWFSLGGGEEYTYEAMFYGHRYAVRSDGKCAEIAVDGRKTGAYPCGQRIITDQQGRILSEVIIENEKERSESCDGN